MQADVKTRSQSLTRSAFLRCVPWRYGCNPQGIGTMFGSNYVGVMAFLGAFGISLAVVGIANLGGRATSVKLLLAGMALSSICSAFSSFIVYFAHRRDGIKDVSYWLMGSFAGASWKICVYFSRLSSLPFYFSGVSYRNLNLMLTWR